MYTVMRYATRIVYVPFKRIENCIKVFNDVAIYNQLYNILFILDERKQKNVSKYMRMWENNENELKIYYWYLLTEYRKRTGDYTRFPFIDFKSPKKCYWENNDLFYISQKIILLRNYFSKYCNSFYIENYKEWPKGGYFPYENPTYFQRCINKNWENYYKSKFGNKIHKIGLYVNKTLNLIEPKKCSRY